MQISSGIRFLRSAIVVSLVVFSCAASWAARHFTPQAGTWVISEELNGKPGRGLAIDVQGNTFFMQVFGYEKNGDATFYTATGQMDGDTVTAPLMRYQGGRSLGGTMQDAVEDKSVGQVTVRFSNGLQGTIQLPGEPQMAIERFLVASDQPHVTNPRAQLGERQLRLFALDGKGDASFTWIAKLSRSEDNVTLLSWYQTSSSPENGPELVQQLKCDVMPGKLRMHCTPNAVQPTTKQLTVQPLIESMRLQFAGYDINGEVRTGGDQPQTYTVLGFDQGATFREPSYRVDRTTFYPQQQQDYLLGNFGWSGGCSVTCTSAPASNTLMPLNGTWVVEDELNGKPGRGIALDIQGNTAILQLFNYRPDGQPTFHMGSAVYQSKSADTRTSVATIPLRQYRGGRSLGGLHQSAQLEAEAGNAILEFTSPKPENGTTDYNVWWSQGTLQLPGETPVKIRRLQTDIPASFAEQIFGEWYAYPDQIARFDRLQGNAVTSADGKIVCLPIGVSPGSNMSCGETNGALWAWHYSMYVPDMGRTGPFLRLRDRFGNAVGLGQLD